jgi:hypothetical protein
MQTKQLMEARLMGPILYHVPSVCLPPNLLVSSAAQ